MTPEERIKLLEAEVEFWKGQAWSNRECLNAIYKQALEAMVGVATVKNMVLQELGECAGCGKCKTCLAGFDPNAKPFAFCC